MIICLTAENERQVKFLAEKISHLKLWHILFWQTVIMATSAVLATVSKLDLAPTVMLTSFGLLVLITSTVKELEEMGKRSYGLKEEKDAFTTFILFYPIFLLLFGGSYFWSASSLVTYGFTKFEFLVNQFSLALGSCMLTVWILGILSLGDKHPEHCFGWSTRHADFHYPEPKVE